MSASPPPLSSREKAQAFLAESSQFQLGELPTEAQHPKTRDLSDLAAKDLPRAIAVFQEVEVDALASLSSRQNDIEDLARVVRETFERGGRVVLCGCGATGRLSLALETLWREDVPRYPEREALADRVVSFMAGGDYALVRSIENFEDHPEFGARQLHDIGFSPADLLIASTEGGETPFVIGATEAAAGISVSAPWFLYCNPPEALKVERSRRVLEDPRVRKISFATGPMAIAGSTRLQASTVLMLAIGAALWESLDATPATTRIRDYSDELRTTDFSGLAALVEIESAAYAQNALCLHRTSHHAISVLTDTTERSPTFSITPFENTFDSASPPSWSYMSVRGTHTPKEAWARILHRAPRALAWPEIKDRYGAHILDGFDFSEAAQKRRQALDTRIQYFDVEHMGEPSSLRVELRIGETAWSFPRSKWIVAEHLLLKCAMNITSTLVMGRLGRFRGNLMLYVKASNKKLIDRAIRFTRLLIADAGLSVPTYEETCYALFDAAETLGAEEPIVLKTFDALCARLK